MKRLLTLTLSSLLTINCAGHSANVPNSKGATMNYSVGTEAELVAASQRINDFKQELLQQGFHEVSVSFSDSTDEFILEGDYGSLTELRVTLRIGKRLQSEPPPFAGGIHASLRDEKAEREFDELYKRVCTVVTGQAESCTRAG
jgi:hypothetical protein